MTHAFSVFRRYFGRSGQSGQSWILLALGFVTLAGFVGITTDISLMFVRYAQLSRAVDSAAIAAANQMRQDRSNATVQLAARQFIEFYGVSPEAVVVDTCLTTNNTDPELCTAEQSKLVRVRAYFRQPTAFMRVFGIDFFDMWVGAISQTAALDVVIVMDVSESMAAQTTYSDWAKVEKLGPKPGSPLTSTTNFGVIYRVPTINEIANRLEPKTVTGEVDGVTYVADLFQSSTGAGAVPKGLLLTPQIRVNNYLTYYPKGSSVGTDSDGNPTTYPAGNKGDNDINTFNGIPAFRVPSYNNYFGSIAKDPRAECRVRFYPRATKARADSFRGEKNADGTFKNYLPLLRDPNVGLLGTSEPLQLDGFVPTYNYFGCCNDPDGDKSFDDLVCQPFKEVRRATFDFLDRIDFLRGDRAAFVTYSRTAILVNPYPYLDEGPGKTSNDETKRPGAMLDDKDVAYATLKDLIGVNAEPYFYVMTSKSSNPKSAMTSWPSQSVGSTENGTPIPINYARLDYDPAIYNDASPESVNYPVFDNCFVQNSTLASPRTLFEGGFANSSLPNETDKLSPLDPLDWPGYNSKWLTQYNTTGNTRGGEPGAEKIIDVNTTVVPATRDYKQDDVSYEYWAACRNGNVGAALREANNALLNPNTSRRFGTIWIIVLMSDGGAGASDPVRRNGRPLTSFKPYLKTSVDPAPKRYGVLGEYGAFGLCPIGLPYDVNPNAVGELITYNDDTNNYVKQADGSYIKNAEAAQPNCADEMPETRHTCDFRPLLTLPSHPSYKDFGAAVTSPLQDNRYQQAPLNAAAATAAYMAGTPVPPLGSTSAQVYAWNVARNNVYDVDIGQKKGYGPAGNLPRGGCDVLYDVEDYARDWADYIAIANLGTSLGNNSQVPTIFTIGFAIAFTNRVEVIGFNQSNGTYMVNNLVTDPAKLVTDPANITQAQVNVDGLCQVNVDKCLGEQLLRYIADVGDNNRIDNDFYQDMMYQWYDLENGGMIPGSKLLADGAIDYPTRRSFGSRDACQVQDPLYFTPPNNNSYDTNNNQKVYDPSTTFKDGNEFANEWGQLRANVSCGNYYYSPNAAELQFVFDDIASRMFTRLSR